MDDNPDSNRSRISERFWTEWQWGSAKVRLPPSRLRRYGATVAAVANERSE